MSELFSQTFRSLGVQHRVSSPYHAESQGVLERSSDVNISSEETLLGDRQ